MGLALPVLVVEWVRLEPAVIFVLGPKIPPRDAPVFGIEHKCGIMEGHSTKGDQSWQP